MHLIGLHSKILSRDWSITETCEIPVVWRKAGRVIGGSTIVYHSKLQFWHGIGQIGYNGAFPLAENSSPCCHWSTVLSKILLH